MVICNVEGRSEKDGHTPTTAILAPLAWRMFTTCVTNAGTLAPLWLLYSAGTPHKCCRTISTVTHVRAP